MRVIVAVLLLLAALSSSAQPQHFRRPSTRSGADGAEFAVRTAAEALEEMKKIYDRDIAVLAHLRASQEALADAMQPAAAIEKAYEHVDKAKRLVEGSVGIVIESIREAHAAIESARRSPGSADFDRLRGLIFRATMPAARVAARNALALEEQILDWIKVQQMISNHLRRMSEIAGESLRSAQ